MRLKITNLNKNFGEKCIFKGFSYSFDNRGIYGLRGESGVGKTTLLRIIAGLDKDYTGEVVGGGIGRVSVAFQEYRLFPGLTALDNIVFAISDGKDRAVFEKAKETLFTLGFSEADMSLYPEELSGGMKQRVSLARAFLADFPILLLDEPIKELDSVNAQAVREMIKTLSEEKLVILVSHNDEDLRLLSATDILITKC